MGFARWAIGRTGGTILYVIVLYCIVLLYCVIVSYYCIVLLYYIVLLYCIVLLYYCIVLLRARPWHRPDRVQLKGGRALKGNAWRGEIARTAQYCLTDENTNTYTKSNTYTNTDQIKNTNKNIALKGNAWR